MLKKKIDFLLIILGVIGFVIILIKIELSRGKECCRALEYYVDMQFKGVIQEKYIDKLNHAVPTLKIVNSDSVFFYQKFYDKSGFYEYCQIGDSVIKKNESIEILVIRDNNKRKFTLDFQCDEL